MVSFYCLFGTIQCGAFSLAVERDPNAWRLTPDVQLASVFYSVSILDKVFIVLFPFWEFVLLVYSFGDFNLLSQNAYILQ